MPVPPSPSSLPLPPGALAVAAGAALVQWATVVLALHAGVGRAMRARGMAWRLRDTLLVSPLFAGGTLVAAGALAAAVLHVAAGAPVASGAVAGAVALAAGALVVAAFGARAVGKLY